MSSFILVPFPHSLVFHRHWHTRPSCTRPLASLTYSFGSFSHPSVSFGPPLFDFGHTYFGSARSYFTFSLIYVVSTFGFPVYSTLVQTFASFPLAKSELVFVGSRLAGRRLITVTCQSSEKILPMLRQGMLKNRITDGTTDMNYLSSVTAKRPLLGLSLHDSDSSFGDNTAIKDENR